MTKLRNDKAEAKYYDWTTGDINPQNLAYLKNSILTGSLDEQETLFRTMQDRWGRLTKLLEEKGEAVKTLRYSVIPWAESGEEPTPEAQEVAKLIENALWRVFDIPRGTWGLSFLEFLSSLTYALARGQAIFQVKKAFDKEKQVFYPAYYKPVLPQHYAWTTNSGEYDRLELYPEGYNTSMSDGREFPKDEFIVAIFNTGIDHPIFSAQLRKLVGWFGAATYGLQWLMKYCHQFGFPFRALGVESQSQIEQAKEDLANSAEDGFIVYTGDETKFQMLNTGGTASNIPHTELIKQADEQASLMIVGQSLTSTNDGKGSNALGNVHNGVREDFITAAASFVTQVINSQLIPMILGWNYGSSLGGKMPQIEFELPNKEKEERKLERVERLVKIGVPMTEQYVYEELGVPMPAPDAKLFQAFSAGDDALQAASAGLRPPKI